LIVQMLHRLCPGHWISILLILSDFLGCHSFLQPSFFPSSLSPSSAFPRVAAIVHVSLDIRTFLVVRRSSRITFFLYGMNSRKLISVCIFGTRREPLRRWDLLVQGGKVERRSRENSSRRDSNPLSSTTGLKNSRIWSRQHQCR